jgi:two-component system phosphate regulon sensor histidine kinase PhoR
MKIRLSHKFLIAFFAIGIAAVAISGLLIERELQDDLMPRIEEEMASGAGIIALMPAVEIVRHVGELAERMRARLTLIDASGKVLADSESGIGEMDNHLNRSELQEARVRGKGAAVRYSRTLKMEMLYVAVPIRDGDKITGYVRLARPLAEVDRFFDAAGQSVIQIVLWTVLILLLIALLFSLRMVSPIRRLAAFTGKIRMGSVSGVLRIESRDEIGDLAENINGMVAALREEIRTADGERRKLKAVFSGMSEGVMVLDGENRIELVNLGMERMSGRPAGEIVDRTILEAFRNVELHDLLERFRQSGEILCQEIGMGNDPPAMMDVTISTVQGDAVGEGKTMLVFHDVTRLKRLERTRTDFVANVTHEIRTPLTAIIGFVETLEQGAMENREKALEFLQTIRENAERLNRLVDDLLTLSAIELGEARLHFERVDVGKALEQALALISPRATEKGVKIIQEIPGSLPAIRADRDRLAQILLNILDNAVKFTPPGGSVAVEALPDEEGRLNIRITDTGVGIPKGEIPRLGERFYRADKARAREMGGTGLGLSIVKHLMKAHEAQMMIDSAMGHGTTVSLKFAVTREAE